MEKLFNNVHKDGSDIYSYNTLVARIDGRNLVEVGRFSQSTTRHIQKVANMFGLSVVKSVERPEFEKLAVGINVKL